MESDMATKSVRAVQFMSDLIRAGVEYPEASFKVSNTLKMKQSTVEQLYNAKEDQLKDKYTKARCW